MNFPPRRAAAILASFLLSAGGLGAQDIDRPATLSVSGDAAPGYPGQATHVVLVVWDGLRPDSVTGEATPTLARLAREGVFFTRHHAVYPTSTEVNGTAMATGCYPGTSGIIGNREYRPEIDPLKPVETELPETVRKGDLLSNGRYLLRPTLAERLQAEGERTLTTSTKRVVLLQDRGRGDRDPKKESGESVTLAEGRTLPPETAETLAEVLGAPFPKDIQWPNTVADRWTTRALAESLWKAGLPKLSVLWLSDPDYTQHRNGPSSPQALKALAGCDELLATVLAALDAGGWRDSTDVFVVSDHGFSTIERAVDVAKLLADAGFRAAREFKETPAPGDVVVNGLGGTVYLYVVGHDADTTARLVRFLQGSDFAGVIFTRDGAAGTFPLQAAHIDSADAPDVAVAMRWTDNRNAAGLPGGVVGDGGAPPGRGTHASLSRYDLPNTLVASGPDFAAGWSDDAPSSNADLAPTVAAILGLPVTVPFDGRVLDEAFRHAGGQHAPVPAPERRAAATDGWKQYLQVTRFGGEDYLEEGNVEAPAAMPAAKPGGVK